MESDQIPKKSVNIYSSSPEEQTTNSRPDLVISVQPSSLGNIPVSTVDWRSRSRGQFIPIHGLDFLIGASSVLIQQTVELNDLTSKIDSENRYIVRIPHAEALYIASETSSSTQRCLCGTGRAFVMHLHDNTRQEAMVFQRRLAAASCLFPCRLQEMKVITPPGDYVGRVQQQCTWITPFYYVRNASDDIIFIIEGPSVIKRSALSLSEFKIFSADGLREIGKICHGWDRDLVSYTTNVVFPNTAAQPKYKALLLASAFLMVTEASYVCLTNTPTLRGQNLAVGGAIAVEYFLFLHYLAALTTCVMCVQPWKTQIFRCGKYLTSSQFIRNAAVIDAMIKPEPFCELPKTNTERTWPFIQYYTGEKDKKLRKNGEGQNYWSGAKSLEWFSGQLVRDTMHGAGTYRWRYLGPNGSFVTYEGHLFNNQLHGYGFVSYGDGRTFNGIFHSNLRWGPGIESHAYVKDDVGFWSGKQLIRLCWRPNAPSVAPDLMCSNLGRGVVKPHRKILSTSVKALGEVNSALEMLKHYGANPLAAVNKCSKLYPDHCTDLSSALSNTELFDNEYYKGNIYTLEEDTEVSEDTKIVTSDDMRKVGNYYSWNNTDTMKHMMKHCYKHEFQRQGFNLDLPLILSGPRKHFKPAGQHEIDCRTLLMASYLGHIVQVAQLVNENNVHPDVADIQGNTAVMYAACGERTDVLHFLVEAGANVNSCNDSCCTPLGVVLINLVCAQKEIAPIDVLQALLPPYLTSGPSSTEKIVSEWITVRDQSPSLGGTLPKNPSKSKNLSAKKIKSLIALKEPTGGKKKSEVPPPKLPEKTSDESFSEDNRVYINVINEYSIRVDNIYQLMSASPVPYIFEVNDMLKEVDAIEEETKKVPDKNSKKVLSKVFKEATKPSKEAMWQSDRDEIKSIDSVEKQKRDRLSRITSTIFQLLSDGADPKLVTCPQPALFIAIASGSSEAVRHLICFGADVNEVYPAILEYRPLDIAISQPFTYDNLEIIRILLEYGADTQHRLACDASNEISSSEISGPTLLHAILARRSNNKFEEEIQHEILQMLLDYNSSPTIQFKGRSAVDISMTKSMDIFDIFIRHPNTNLNAVINELSQSVLLKIFYLPFFKTVGGMERLQKITDLLLFGANPLLDCQNGEETYKNFFVFAKKTLSDLEGNQSKSGTLSGAAKQDPKSKKMEKPKKEERNSTKSAGKMVDDIGEYRQALELVTECARLLHIRWLQANIVKDLVVIIKMFSHRHWNMILKELKQKKIIGLWLTPQRCLEIWNILASAKKKCHDNRHILKHLLYIVQFCNNRILNCISLRKPITTLEKGITERNIKEIHDYKDSESFSSEVIWKRCYVKPELISKYVKIFDVCFECSMPSSTDKIMCPNCKLVSFCSFECMKINIDRVNCHPCSEILKDKYFLENNDSIAQDF